MYYLKSAFVNDCVYHGVKTRHSVFFKTVLIKPKCSKCEISRNKLLVVIPSVNDDIIDVIRCTVECTQAESVRIAPSINTLDK